MAGLLADVFSYGDTAKRKLKGLLADPVGTFQQFVGNENDRAGQFNQLTSQATDERVNRMKTGGSMGVSEQRLAGLLADAYNPMGMVVWHGSPHKFAKFDSSKIGTGEGAQAYGHGLYLAERPDVAKEYIESNGAPEWMVDGVSVGTHTPTAYAAKLLATDGTPPVQAINNARSLFSRIKQLTPEKSKYLDDAIAEVNRLQQSGAKIEKGGSLYKVDLPDEHIAKMLDWDKPLSQQQSLLDVVGNKLDQTRLGNELGVYRGKIPSAAIAGSATYGSKAQPATGADLYRRIAGSQWAKENPSQASELLRNAGIPGIRYLDGGSRGTGQGTSNFVVFPGNENLLQILERNGKPLNGLLD